MSGWARDGLTDEQIASNMGIVRSTLSEWKNKYKDIADTLKSNKEVADLQVENALFKRAVGYQYKEVTKQQQNGKMVVTKEVTKEIVPDTTAIIYWLKNRQPDKWRDKRKEEINVDIEDLTPIVEMIAHDENTNN